MEQQQILNYYEKCHIDYQLIWGANRSFSLHYGYHDTQHKRHHAAVLNMNRVVAQHAGITSESRVLDAGCGIGGSCVWLAENLGARMTGVNISAYQLERARQLAKDKMLSDQIEYKEASFTDTGLKADSFDVVWGMEAVCYAEEKKDFIKEAYRLLKPGGKLVVADGFFNDVDINFKCPAEYRIWLDGWAVPDLAGQQQFQTDMTETGFKHIQFHDVSEAILPSAIRMHLAAVLLYPGGKILEWLKIRKPIQTQNIIAANYQYVCLKKEAWHYGIVVGEK